MGASRLSAHTRLARWMFLERTGFHRLAHLSGVQSVFPEREVIIEKSASSNCCHGEGYAPTRASSTDVGQAILVSRRDWVRREAQEKRYALGASAIATAE